MKKSEKYKLGEIKEVDINSIWTKKQNNFSDWLTKDENLYELGSVIGLTLGDVSKDVYVGSYKCDLFAKDETSEIKIIIENELGKTNFDDLGRLITYASGLDAQVIVWIVKQTKEEHISAFKWLNENTNNDVGFFLIEMHAYKIDDSLPAPKFEIIEKPNDFIKNNKGSNSGGKLTKLQFQKLNFWIKFNEMIIETKQPFKISKAWTRHYYNIRIEIKKAHIFVALNHKIKQIMIGLYICDNQELYDHLYEKKQEIKNNLLFDLEWHKIWKTTKNSVIATKIDGLNFDDQSNYQQLMNEIIKRVTKMIKFFKKLIK